MSLQRWNFDKREYEPYSVPDDWNISVYCYDMNTVVNCAECGRKMAYGEGYTSRRIHTNMGFGYCVCEECYQKEWADECAQEAT